MDIEWVSGVAFVVMFVGYNLVYFRYTKIYPKKTQKGRQNIYREYWIENVLKGERGMVAVQQIRNMTTITTFLASSTLIFMGVAVSYARGSLPGLQDYYDYKLYALIGIIALAFFNFLFTLRTANEITILIESSPSKIEELEGIPAVEYLTKKTNQAFLHHTFGMRCLYYSIPLFFWFFSPVVFVALTVVITAGIAKFLDF
ncbi:MAG: DUF599 domain-containing protein [Theionarchaea archaeon]|nr:DUF599 domain-containing protein [Theionarchaea archaeon]MBU7039880.1 DUF599 domain-containing protein [Theionarchaea archaeon]